MNPTALAPRLNALLATQSHSLADHLQRAKPYLPAGSYRMASELEAIAHLSMDHARRLTVLIQRLSLPLLTTRYDPGVARFHFMALPTLLPLLIDERDQQIRGYDQLLQGEPLDDWARRELENLRAESQTQRDQLADLQPRLAQASPTQEA